jgi:hypothetical protein
MIVLVLPCGFDTLEYSWVKATIGICMLADYPVSKKCQQTSPQWPDWVMFGYPIVRMEALQSTFCHASLRNHKCES